MNTSGTQKPPVHVASCDCIAGGTSAACRQWAPPKLPHAGSVLGSMMGGPVYGQAAAGAAPSPSGTPPPLLDEPEPPPSAEHVVGGLKAQAPEGCLVSGLVHGAQSSVAAHVLCVRMLLYCATCGTQRLRHAPGVPLNAVHEGGT